MGALISSLKSSWWTCFMRPRKIQEREANLGVQLGSCLSREKEKQMGNSNTTFALVQGLFNKLTFSLLSCLFLFVCLTAFPGTRSEDRWIVKKGKGILSIKPPKQALGESFVCTSLWLCSLCSEIQRDRERGRGSVSCLLVCTLFLWNSLPCALVCLCSENEVFNHFELSAFPPSTVSHSLNCWALFLSLCIVSYM